MLTFRQGAIDSSGWHGTRDARLLAGGRLAVLTGGGGCPDRPKSVSGSGSQVTITYRHAVPANGICTDILTIYTAVVRLPAEVSRTLPLQVTVQLPGVPSYIVAARENLDAPSPVLPTASGMLRMTGGPAGATQPGAPGSVYFDPVNKGQRRSATAAADGSFTIALPPGQYTVTGTSPQFESGNGLCRAEDPITVPPSGVSGLIVACPRR